MRPSEAYLHAVDPVDFSELTYGDAVAADLSMTRAELIELLSRPAGRRQVTRTRPMLFALLYFRHTLVEATGVVSFAPFHLDLYQDAATWIKPDQKSEHLRNAYAAARGIGKTSTLLKIIPAWLGAHGHITFAACFSDSPRQAELHLSSFRDELRSNKLLRDDYPEFVKVRRVNDKNQLPGADTVTSLRCSNGFNYQVFGIGQPIRGLKIGDKRPDWISLDDVEKGEENYSLYEMSHRLNTILKDVFYLELTARVCISGTVTRPGSIIHQLVQSVLTGEDPEPWIPANEITVHHYPALIGSGDDERSCWPQRWSTEYLQKKRASDPATYWQEMENQPRVGDLRYWTTDLFRYEPNPKPPWRTIIWVDPAVTQTDKSDFTGVAVLSLSRDLVLTVHEAFRLKCSAPDLRNKLLDLLTVYSDVVYVMVERNQGGELWPSSVLHNFVVPVNPPQWDRHPQTSSFSNKTASKHLRIQNLCNAYQRGQVQHTRSFPQLEQEELGWPDGLVKDTVDAVATGAQHLYAAYHLGKQTSSQSMSAAYA